MNDAPPPPPMPASDMPGIRVRILDLSGGAEEGIVEEVGPFPDAETANAFARRYVRDSMERCRAAGMAPQAVLDAWFAFGEDAEVLGAEGGWRSATELADFSQRKAKPADRDWRSLDPRLAGEEDEE